MTHAPHEYDGGRRTPRPGVTPPETTSSAPAAGSAPRFPGPSRGVGPATCTTSGRSRQVATTSSHATPDVDRAGWSGEARKT